jgi:hypothetical protein
VIRVTLVGQSASEVRRTNQAKGHQNDTNPHSHLPKPEPYQRLGSGDGERKTLLTRQIAFEPLPASVLFGERKTLLTRQIAFEPLLSWAASKSQDDHLTETSLF